MQAAGATSVRGFHPNKPRAELTQFGDAKLELSGILMWSPTRPMTLPVADLEGFRRYVAEQVTRYRGLVSSWEVWNEPPNFTVDKSPTSYGAVVAAAFEAAKAIDPNVKVGLAAKSVDIHYLADAIEAGARDKFDFISLHPYEVAGLIRHGCERPFLSIAGNVRAMLREHNPTRANVPIRFTEVGVEVDNRGPDPLDETVQADTLVKIYSMAIAQGIEQVDWFDPRDSEGKHHGLLRANGSPRPAYEAYKQLRAALGRSPEFLGYVSLTEGSLGLLFAGSQSDVLVVWLPPHTTKSLKFEAASTVISPTSGRKQITKSVSLSSSPILVFATHRSELSVQWRATARRAAGPLATSNQDIEVELKAGAPPNGVYLISSRTHAEQHIAGEVDLSGTRGALFAVDANFLGYSSEPIEVKLVVRGHGRSTGGFNLKYESHKPVHKANDHGMVTAGHWNFVKGSSPITLTWRLDDASFVSKYGGNLNVDCDGPEHCDFGILSLAIRKLRPTSTERRP